jgi:ABC-type nitrate/sulfonate/bicarbonate transport system substrate-binding protein
VNPDTDIVTMPLGSDANKIAALKGGAVDAAILTLPDDSIAEELGFKRLAFAADFVEGVQSGLATSVKKIKEKPDQVKRMARVLLRGLELARTDRNYGLDFIVRQWQVSRRVAENSYDLMVRTFSTNGEAPEKAIRDLVDEIRRDQKIERQIALSEVVDFSFVREAAKR